MALEWTTTAAPVEDSGVKALVYAPGGYGKTVLTATLPGNPVIISAESGLLSLQPANQLRMWGVAREIPVIKITKPQELEEAHQFLVNDTHGKKFTDIGIDSISEIAETLLAQYLRIFSDPRKAYGEMQFTMLKYLRLFRDLKGRNVIMTAKQDRIIDANAKQAFGPSMPGKTMEREVTHLFDEMFALVLLDIKDANGHNIRALRTRPDVVYHCKDRSGALLEIEQPNLSVVIGKIQNQQVAVK